MLSSRGFENVVTNLYKLSCGRAGGESVENVSQLRAFYLEFLRDIYPNVPVNTGPDFLICDVDIEEKLAAAFQMNDPMGNPDQQIGFIGETYPTVAKADKITFARGALDELLALDDDLRSIFELVVHSVIVRKPKRMNGRITHSSSAGTAVGVIWLSVVDTLNKHDLQELFIHELVHQLLFIDDFVHSQFQYAVMSERQNCALTAITLTPRPLDIVIHSIVVAAEILIARDRLLGEPDRPNVHPSTDKILSTIATSHASVTRLPSYAELVTPHIGRILDRSMAHIESLRLQRHRSRESDVPSLRV